MNRQQVYDTINGERDYQEKVWGPAGENRNPHGPKPGAGPDHTVGNFIVFMDTYLTKAKVELSTKEGHASALDMLRKVVALGIACFEQHGVPEREGHPARPLYSFEKED